MAAFYRDVLGMSIVEEWDRSPLIAVRSAGRRGGQRDDRGAHAGRHRRGGRRPRNVVLTMFVDDAQTAVQQIRTAGVRIARDVEDTPWGHRSFGVDDPDGLRIWIVEELATEGASE